VTPNPARRACTRTAGSTRFSAVRRSCRQYDVVYPQAGAGSGRRRESSKPHWTDPRLAACSPSGFRCGLVHAAAIDAPGRASRTILESRDHSSQNRRWRTRSSHGRSGPLK
jgi:hypothetical protein